MLSSFIELALTSTHSIPLRLLQRDMNAFFIFGIEWWDNKSKETSIWKEHIAEMNRENGFVTRLRVRHPFT